MADNEPTPGGEVWEPGAHPAPRKAPAAPRPRRGAIWNPANRRNSREWALQMLFLADANPPADGIDTTIEEFWEFQAVEGEPPAKNLRDFAEQLVRGTWQNRDAIDARISSYLENWTLDRIGGVDRAILRLAMYELFFRDETPPVVILNEAVDVAKFFSTRDTGKFVNGVLDRAMKDVTRPQREARKPAWVLKMEAKRAAADSTAKPPKK